MNGILVPVFLYPVMLWVIFTGLSFSEGLADGFSSRIAFADVPPVHQGLIDSLGARDDTELVTEVREWDEGLEAIRSDRLDAFVELVPTEGAPSLLPDNVTVRIAYDDAIDRSRRARERVESVVWAYRASWIEREADDLGLGTAEREQFGVAGYNVATEREMGGLLLGTLIPLFLVIMVAIGCLVPAVDTTAGERERSTWETLMTVSASRLSVVASKYLYVATLGITAGILNVVAVFVSIGAVLRPLLASTGSMFSFSLPLLSVPVMMMGAIALALFFAAVMMILAAFARSFKEGQAMVTPAIWMALLPMIVAQGMDRNLSAAAAAIPVANVAIMIRDAVTGVFLWPFIAETLVVTMGLVVVMLLVARVALGFEDFVMGSYDGTLWRFFRERLFGRAKAPPVGVPGD